MEFEITWQSGLLGGLLLVVLPLVGRFVSAKLAMLGAAIALIALWASKQIYPVGLAVCAGVLLVLWVDYRQRRRCPGCGTPVAKPNSLCESCRKSFEEDLGDGNSH